LEVWAGPAYSHAVPPARSGRGLTFKAYAGDGAVLLAFDVDEPLRQDLAGFAIEYTDPDGIVRPVFNRINFQAPVTKETTPEERAKQRTDTKEAPIQKFHWVHFPGDVKKGEFKYRVSAMRYRPGTDDQVDAVATEERPVRLMPEQGDIFQLGFTRGYLSSQAYLELFKGEDFIPKPLTLDADTASFSKKWRWLGFHGRRLVFDFLEEALDHEDIELDVFAFDLDEPDVIRALERLGSRLRLFQDNSATHVEREGKRPLELDAIARLEAKGAQVKVGNFSGLAHSKVFIQRRGDTAVKVLAGSANFSARGLYAQSNNVFVFDDPQAADLYEQAFKQAWNDEPAFRSSQVAAGWMQIESDRLPACAVSFAPHRTETVSLDRVAEAIRKAKSSVLFAIMEIGAGGGPALEEIRKLPERDELYAFGTTQKLDGDLKVTAPADPDSPFIPFSYLKSKVPPPFDKEIAGGSGQIIHHKFVVVDFNGEDPKVYAGSSNLAKAESSNGDNLVEFADRDVATKYAVEAIRLIDHYRFRSVQNKATTVSPLRLKRRGEDWAKDFFDPKSPRSLERTVFVGKPREAGSSL
jgi:phosphatidylserine/phosphatidylglycerophosphate/cardiolipin synthase-like enzyme